MALPGADDTVAAMYPSKPSWSFLENRGEGAWWADKNLGVFEQPARGACALTGRELLWMPPCRTGSARWPTSIADPHSFARRLACRCRRPYSQHVQ